MNSPLKTATSFNNLVRIREGYEWKTTFNTPTAYYEHLVVPFGLTNAPAVFQALINDVLRDFFNVFVFAYFDDILVFSCSLREHKIHVCQVLQKLLKNKLFGMETLAGATEHPFLVWTDHKNLK